MRQLELKKVRNAVSGVAARLPRKAPKRPVVTRQRALIGGGALVVLATGVAAFLLTPRRNTGEVQVGAVTDGPQKGSGDYVIVRPLPGSKVGSFLIPAVQREEAERFQKDGTAMPYILGRKKVEGVRVGRIGETKQADKA